VLIPRPETEELLTWILEDWPDQAGLKVIDLGTGSGILPICLKLARPNWDITGIDISAAALAIAQKNAAFHHVQIDWLELDMLHAELPGKFDLILSNPPYITVPEAADMAKQVVDFEPHQALFVPETDALIFYKRIARWAENQPGLKAVYMELNKNKALETSALFDINSSDKLIRKDLNGHDRMLRVFYAKG
jgi:release factor glutamine methyltransferase